MPKHQKMTASGAEILLQDFRQHATQARALASARQTEVSLTAFSPRGLAWPGLRSAAPPNIS